MVTENKAKMSICERKWWILYKLSHLIMTSNNILNNVKYWKKKTLACTRTSYIHTYNKSTKLLNEKTTLDS